jgi:hypothetical protein
MNRNLVGSIYMYVEGSVLSFLKAEWKVSDTGSAHWASSLLLSSILVFIEKMNPIFILILSFVLIFFTFTFLWIKLHDLYN